MDPAAPIRTESQGHVVVGIAIGFAAVTMFILMLRLYTRLVLLKTAGIDDWTIVAAMAFTIVATVTTCFEVKYGLGRHMENVTPEEGLVQLKYLLITIILYNMGMNVVKTSFLFQYRRIFQSKIVQTICFWAMIYVILWACVQSTLLGTSCLPIAMIVPSTAGWCLNTLPIWYFSSAMSLATDLLIFLIPLPSVYKLQLPTRQKIIVFCIFCLGFFVCIISVYRMFTLRDAVEGTDPPWTNVGAAIWSLIELNCSIICSSLPTLRPLISKIVPGLSSISKSRSAYERYGSKYAGTGSASRIRNKGTYNESKSTPRSISTEELALSDIESNAPGRLPGVYAHCSADVEHGIGNGSLQQGRENKHIIVTTETSIRENKGRGGF